MRKSLWILILTMLCSNAKAQQANLTIDNIIIGMQKQLRMDSLLAVDVPMLKLKSTGAGTVFFGDSVEFFGAYGGFNLLLNDERTIEHVEWNSYIPDSIAYNIAAKTFGKQFGASVIDQLGNITYMKDDLCVSLEKVADGTFGIFMKVCRRR